MASPPNLQNLPFDAPTDAATDNTRSSSARVTFTPNTQSMALSPTSISLALKSPEGIDCYGNERQALAEQSKFFNNSLLSDVNLVVGGQRYYAHKIVLVRASDVFERMFSSEWSSSGKKVGTGTLYLTIGFLTHLIQFGLILGGMVIDLPDCRPTLEISTCH